MIKWFKDNGVELVFVVVIAATGGLAGASVPTLWFMHGVCR